MAQRNIRIGQRYEVAQPSRAKGIDPARWNHIAGESDAGQRIFDGLAKTREIPGPHRGCAIIPYERLRLALAKAFPTAEPEHLVLSDRSAGRAPELVSAQRGNLHIEKIPCVQSAVADVFPNGSANSIASALGDCRDHRSGAADELGRRVAGLGAEFMKRLERRQNGENLVLDVLQVHAVNEVQVIAPAQPVYNEVAGRHTFGDVAE